MSDILSKKFSKKIRLYFIYKSKHYFINNGNLVPGFSPKIIITKDRDKIISAFSKMGFLFDEIIRMRIVGYSNEKNNDELLYILNLVPLNRKIRTFLDWKVFSPEYTRDMSRLFEVRNALTHAVSINDIQYNPDKPISISTPRGFSKFKTDFEKSWKTLLKIYEEQQRPVYRYLETMT